MFLTTHNFFTKSNDILDKAVQHEGQFTKLYEEDDYPELPEVKSGHHAKAYVSK